VLEIPLLHDGLFTLIRTATYAMNAHSTERCSSFIETRSTHFFELNVIKGYVCVILDLANVLIWVTCGGAEFLTKGWMILPVFGVSGASSIGSLTVTGVYDRWNSSARGGNKIFLTPYSPTCVTNIVLSSKFYRSSCCMIASLSSPMICS
jgi:hypothetical protein